MPYICIFAACAIADRDVWYAIISKLQRLNDDGNVGEGSQKELDDIQKRKNSATSKSNSNPTTNSVLTTFVQNVMIIFVIVFLFQSKKESINTELEDLREFWDPDTVDLMEWIIKDTPRNAAFTGSMQLLAGVRLCTWRPITNHPHFEDKDLRDRTKEVCFSQFLDDTINRAVLMLTIPILYDYQMCFLAFSYIKYMDNSRRKRFMIP